MNIHIKMKSGLEFRVGSTGDQAFSSDQLATLMASAIVVDRTPGLSNPAKALFAARKEEARYASSTIRG
ncbi:MAG: hypothetical protein ABI162_06850 [Luteolibacter sp.]